MECGLFVNGVCHHGILSMIIMVKFHTARNNLLTQHLQLNTALAWIARVGIVQQDKNAY